MTQARSAPTPAKRGRGRPRKAPPMAPGGQSAIADTTSVKTEPCGDATNPYNFSRDLLDTGPPPGTETLDLSNLSDADLVKATLRAVMLDPAAPAAAKAQAARTLAEITNQIGRLATPAVDDGKPITRLTRAELERELAARAVNRSAPDA